MASYSIRIEATITARNLASANSKLEDLKHRIERKVDAHEIRLVGQKETGT